MLPTKNPEVLILFKAAAEAVKALDEREKKLCRKSSEQLFFINCNI